MTLHNSRLRLQQDTAFLRKLVPAGSSVAVGGFGEPGTPFFLIDALAAFARDLTVIKNDGNEPGSGVGQLLRNGALTRLITSHVGLNAEIMQAMHDGTISVDFHPQGILAEKLRCAGAGIPAFLSDIGVGELPLVNDSGQLLREQTVWRGREYFIESALHADVALIHAHRADRFGNLAYRSGARNFNPLMAQAARVVVAQVEELQHEPLDPEGIHTPFCFVDHLVVVPAGFDAGTRTARLKAAAAKPVGHA